MTRAQRTAEVARSPHTSRDPVCGPDVTAGDLSTYLQRAMRRLGIQVKEVAACWQTDHAYVSRVLSNHDPLPDHRIKQLPKQLRIAVLVEWATEEDVPVARKADLTHALAAIARLADVDPLEIPIRMAKATLPESGA